MNPLVTIITPTYNSESFVGRAVESVLNQTFENWEMIVVDDCSSDNTAKRVEEYSVKDSRVKLHVLNENKGAAVARNTAIDLAVGRYIFFLDSDDAWMPSKLESQLDFFFRTGAAFIYSSYEKIDESGRVLGVVEAPAYVAYNDLLKSCNVGCLTAAYDTKALGKMKMPLIKKRQDLGLWLRILKVVPFGYGQSDVLATYTLRNGSVSSNKMQAAKYQWCLYREFEGLGFFCSLYFFVHYAVRGVVKTKLPALARLMGL